ncbi:MAG: phosphomannomutase/phosphoglucomutase [Flexistipes sinusarabici]|uniref:Phosphomannomutase/phosphoglucomutase n=1 Tax=Flexistipes sinusarabici TaxID=2352 RepID=A0A5D0MND3_FLESI|nr:phosphomannomutase/phosphoglucomutase [Flexistipes sinusarabici]TYB33123.1 MAG: phosphomannomutase/phosphoglucomutase [Flexistipes sinusarabici]
MVDANIFRQYDIRGIVPDTFNKDVAQQIANAFAFQVKSETGNRVPAIAVGRDARLSSKDIFNGVADGIKDAGCDVVELGVCPTPATYFSSFFMEMDAFIMITGSHNPPEYNGIKLGIGHSTYHSEKITSIYEDITRYGYINADMRGQHRVDTINKYYIDWNIEHFAPLKDKISSLNRNINVVIDAGNGVASHVAPEIFEALGVKVTKLYCEPDGNFPNHHPDPTVEDNLSDLKEKIKQRGADFGVAYDGDADRIGIIDEKQDVIWGDLLLLIYAKELKKKYEKPKIIADVKASKVLFDSLEKIGAEGIMWKTGHSLIKNKLQETGAELAGEMSGHIFFKDEYYGYDDAIYASLRFLEAYVNNLSEENIGKVSDLLRDIPEVYNTPEIRFDCPDDKKFEVVNKLAEKFKNYLKEGKLGIKEIIDIDGIRVVFENGWGLLRASNTQPVLVMRFEATDKAEMEQYRKIIEKELKEMMDL